MKYNTYEKLLKCSLLKFYICISFFFSTLLWDCLADIDVQNVMQQDTVVLQGNCRKESISMVPTVLINKTILFPPPPLSHISLTVGNNRVAEFIWKEGNEILK